MTVCLQREGHTNGSISSACAVDQMVQSVVSVAVATSTSVLWTPGQASHRSIWGHHCREEGRSAAGFMLSSPRVKREEEKLGRTDRH
jgi:hypothetical protein